jgi:hypothetical protein
MKVDQVSSRMQIFALGLGRFPRYVRRHQTILSAWVSHLWTLSMLPEVGVDGLVGGLAFSPEEQRHQDDVCNRTM